MNYVNFNQNYPLPSIHFLYQYSEFSDVFIFSGMLCAILRKWTTCFLILSSIILRVLNHNAIFFKLTFNFGN
jgi:hypothetical protein